MKLVLLSGGSGTRLWPMSGSAHSKQFLRILEGPSGETESMLQRIWRQLKEVGLAQDTLICAPEIQKQLVLSQVGDVPIIVEPSRRDTFAAVALSCAYLSQHESIDDDEPIVIAPVDHFVDLEYFSALTKLPETLSISDSDLALLGVKPTDPSTQFGYILCEEEAYGTHEYRRVRCFREKPSLQRATTYLEQGALWSCGVMCFRTQYLKRILESRGLPILYNRILNHYESFPKRSISYEVLETADRTVALTYSNTWEDLGTWETLSPHLPVDMMGEGVISGSENCNVINQTNMPVIVNGLKDIVVVATPDGILVSDKKASRHMRDVLNSVPNSNVPQSGGLTQIVTSNTLPNGSRSLTRILEVAPNDHTSYEVHAYRAEKWTVIEGDGILVLDGQVRQLSPGAMVTIAKGQAHAVKACSRLRIIQVLIDSIQTDHGSMTLASKWNDTIETSESEVS